jgi:hypothetical protein
MDRENAEEVRTAEPLVLTPQQVRAEDASTAHLELRLPVSERDRRPRRMRVGGQVLEVPIDDEDRRRGYVAVRGALGFRCDSIPHLDPDLQICNLVLVVCTDEDTCITIG